MRYPQYFATKSIENHLSKGVKKGIVWHTQGSGKTALAFYNTKYLTDYFQKQNTITKFYFIVDRLDLLDQAKKEFQSRGLVVHTVNSRDELVKDFMTDKASHNTSGSLEITVVNIQKFGEDTSIFEEKKYSTNIQRIYFLDEVHRSYDPKGSFLANLITSDREAIMIGLTGTPLLGDEKNSKNIFGDYFHKYYYNQSIADGYTLKLLREEIATQYKLELNKTLEDIEIEKGKIDTNLVYSDKRFVEPMLQYIIEDFKNTRIMHNDKTIGSMVICHSSDQAKMFYKLFNEKYNDIFKASLILHDIGDKERRKKEVEDFKKGSIDILFVYNMLLTGFDAHRLKKLYIGRVVRKHNLLQALTRVNRPYNKFRFGYVVDFADIKKEFDKTNKAYFEELQLELGDELDKYSDIFLSPEDVILEIKEIEDTLFSFDTVNAEIFSQQISRIEDSDEMLLIKNALSSAKDLYNTIKLMGYTELIEKLDFKNLSILYKEAENHLNLINLKKAIGDESNTNNLLNLALEDIVFTFEKKSEEEMKIADEGYNLLASTRAEFNNNFDKSDVEYGKLYEELRRLFESKNFGEISQTELVKNINSLEKIYKAIKDLNRRNSLLKDKYSNDKKFAVIHKKMMNREDFSEIREVTFFDILSEIKENIDLKILNNKKAINNESFFTRLISPMVMDSFLNQKVELDNQAATLINTIIAEQYLYDFNTI
jgi:type I restriction enzyme R subunit